IYFLLYLSSTGWTLLASSATLGTSVCIVVLAPGRGDGATDGDGDADGEGFGFGVREPAGSAGILFACMAQPVNFISCASFVTSETNPRRMTLSSNSPAVLTRLPFSNV